MQKVNYFNSIPISLPKERIYARLGYSPSRTTLSSKQKDLIEAAITEAEFLLNLSGAGRIISLKAVSSREVILENNIVFKSSSLANFLASSEKSLIMAATAGEKIISAIEEKSKNHDLTTAVVYDAVASETVDACLSWIMSYYRRILRRENRTLPLRRFSCGYGDLSLENQKIIWELLGLSYLGIEITEQFILRPEKTVTAICGVVKLTQDKKDNEEKKIFKKTS